MRKSKASVLFYIVALCTLVLYGCVPSGTEDVAEEPVKNSVQASEGPVYEYETQELFAERDGNQIYGIIYIPQNAG